MLRAVIVVYKNYGYGCCFSVTVSQTVHASKKSFVIVRSDAAGANHSLYLRKIAATRKACINRRDESH